MRISFAAVLATLAVGAVATEVEQTVYVTEYATICQATSLPSGIPTAPAITVSNGVTYSISRPLITSTVTHCEKCSTSVPVIPVPTAVSPNPSGSVVIPSSSPVSSTPLIPSGSVPVPSGVSPSGSATTPATPLFTAGASRAAVGAGAGLATVFGLVAYLL
ncbi:hypothetical protein EYZ11_009302 [Aspergillus tanneri]|uniref:Clock-controlled protein 6 n=1 Tax=Aspergillus tanneri TaxID=1220188 RepID=A0A4V6RQQ7_9EURO|nr:uncharacterized protein ATNIH1004_001220 [Aspergillus tanneri]KAA8652316.1 hypothetical protein ATNIH1004_001220 [Aspergillus tanneri]THC91244.1 hypothetical protein EYZ11_009302 [Aspergillus tanneri]